jgi:GTPase
MNYQQLELGIEKDEGNIEYKLKLINLDTETLNKRSTQMLYRVNEGNGEAIYYIGVLDNGSVIGINNDEYNESIGNLKIIASNINCTISAIVENNVNELNYGVFLIRNTDNNYIDLRIGVAGNVDAGKSTTIGTLTYGILDDGRGKARVNVFNHRHEIETGRTSSISSQILGYDSYGEVVNSKFLRQPTWSDIVSKSFKIITFYDLAGHEKYLKTTIYGLTSIYPDYCLIMVGANVGISHMTREHIGLCVTLKIPFVIIITKIDIAPSNILEETITNINMIIKNGIRKKPYMIKNRDDIFNAIKLMNSETIIPVIQISNVLNINLDLLKTFLNLLPLKNTYSGKKHNPIQFNVDNTYSVVGHSTIVSGLLVSGTVKTGDNLHIGPFSDSTYKKVKVRTIHCKYRDIKEASAGSYICLSLKNIARNEIRKGLVIIDDNSSKIASKTFYAFIHILHSPTTIKIGYQPFIHVEHIKQSVRIVDIQKIENSKKRPNPNNILDIDKHNLTFDVKTDDEIVLRTGDIAYVKLEFVFVPEYIKPDMKLVFREGKVKAIGKVVQLFV